MEAYTERRRYGVSWTSSSRYGANFGALPGAGPHYLLLESDDYRPLPCNFWSRPPGFAAYLLDDVQLTP